MVCHRGNKFVFPPLIEAMQKEDNQQYTTNRNSQSPHKTSALSSQVQAQYQLTNLPLDIQLSGRFVQ